MLRKVKIKNFKCFVDLDIAFNNYTILVGANGVGKSTIIQSMLIGRHILESYQVGSHKSQFKLMLNGPYLLELGQSKDVISSNATSNQIELEYITDKDSICRIQLEESKKHQTHYLLANANWELDKSEYLGTYFRYINAERLGPRKALDKGENESVYTGHRGEFTSYAIETADRDGVEVPEFLKKVTETNKFSRQVEAWFNEIMKNVQFVCKPINELNVVALNYKNEQLDIDFYPANSTGFGMSYVLPIIVECLFLASKGEKGFIVIENPEAHLHPYSQSKLGKFLALTSKAGVQVIVETHSEHIINGARIEMAKEKINDKLIINYVNQNDNGSYVETITSNEFGELSNWPTGFFDQEESDLKELLMLKLKNRG